MLKAHTIYLSLLLLLLPLSTALAQDEIAKSDKGSTVIVTASASGDRVRLTAPSSVVQIRLEVYNSTGKKLFDNEVRGGNVLDWHLQDGRAEPLADDTYLYVVTVKSLSGKLLQRIGSVTVEKSSASVQPVEASQLTAQQSQAIGPIEENASLTILKQDDNQTTTVIAHNGDEGQITRGRGALSFRIGDFFSGKDTEQMRLTAEGNLGIGITHPQVRLDVDGLIRASQGVVFPDGSIQFSAASKTLGAKSTFPDQILGGKHKFQTEAAGAGTQNQIAKWTDNAGTLGNSGITETASGDIGIGTATPGGVLDLQRSSSGDILQRFWNTGGGGAKLRYVAATGATSQVQLTDLNEWLMAIAGNNTVGMQFQVRAPSDPNTEAGLAAAARMTILRNGNVGIGTTNPGFPLTVNGVINSTTGGFRFPDGTVQATAATGGGGSVTHDLTLTGNGTGGSPLGIAVGGVGPNQLGAGAVTGPSIEVPLNLTGSSTNPVLFVENIGTGAGVRGQSDSGIGLYGKSASGMAGFFSGDVNITGNLTKGTGSFKIDHPLDPENKYLYHSFVESPDMMNIYNGNIVTDAKGEATIGLPEYFESLNRDFRYQLTVIGEFAQAIVASKIKSNRFSIKTDKPNIEVSWQVTGVRKDPYAEKHRVPVEEKKTESERGHYLHPKEYGQPEEKGIEWIRFSGMHKPKKQP